MSFRSRTIRQQPPKKTLKKAGKVFGDALAKVASADQRKWSYLLGAALVLFGLFVVVKVTMAAYHMVADFSLGKVASVVGQDLKKDVNGYTNIVLLGDGGGGHDGEGLVDTIIVASIDYQNSAATLLSIPRDYFVTRELTDYPGRINTLYATHKANLSENESFETFQQVVGGIVNLDIHYYVRVDFHAFVELVDSLGGITVDVKEAIYDPYYPTERDDGYTIFRVQAGPQEMDGETALKFVRSRKTTSDFDRAFRQQQVIEAMREKALSAKVLTSPSTLSSIYESVKSNMNTNMTVREMISLAGFGVEFNRERLISRVLHDDPGREGGFLYTPERELYGGQFVLLPYGGDLKLIHKYADLLFNHRFLFFNSPVLQVLNATKRTGLASQLAYQLNRFGFNVAELGNYLDEAGERAYSEKTMIFYDGIPSTFADDETEEASENDLAQRREAAELMTGFLRGIPLQSEFISQGGQINIKIILGADYQFLVP